MQDYGIMGMISKLKNEIQDLETMISQTDDQEFIERESKKITEKKSMLTSLETRVKVIKSILKENGKIKLNSETIRDKVLEEGRWLRYDSEKFVINTLEPDFKDVLNGYIDHDEYEKMRSESFERKMIKEHYGLMTQMDIISVMLSQPEKFKITIEYKE